MTVGRLLQEIDSAELTEWQALWTLDAEAAHRRSNGIGPSLTAQDLKASLAGRVVKKKRE